MRLIILNLALTLVACASAASFLDKALDTQLASNNTLKSYGIKEIERRLIWQNNTNFIAKHNTDAEAGLYPFKKKNNQFGDMTGFAFGKMNNDKKSNKLAVTTTKSIPTTTKAIPTTTKAIPTTTKAITTTTKANCSKL